MKHIKTFEQYSAIYDEQLDEAFLGIGKKKTDTVTKTKGLIKYFIDKKSVKNYQRWFNHLATKNVEDMKSQIDTYYDKLKGSKGAHIFGEGNKGTGGFAQEVVSTLADNPTAYDDEIATKIQEIAPKINLDPKVICDKLGLECKGGQTQGQAQA